jgi:hypothetical protein
MRNCQNKQCGKPLPMSASLHRKFCNDKCHFEQWESENPRSKIPVAETGPLAERVVTREEIDREFPNPRSAASTL